MVCKASATQSDTCETVFLKLVEVLSTLPSSFSRGWVLTLINYFVVELAGVALLLLPLTII
jgi:hypothetical protein